MPKGKGRQRKRTRKRTWDAEQDVDAALREPRRVRGRETGVGAPVDVECDLSECFTDVEPNGRVISPYGVLAFVLTEEGERLCRVTDSLTDGKTSVLAPGDEVRVEQCDDGPTVTAVRRRHTTLSRPAIYKAREQVFAANIDLLVVVTSTAKPPFRAGLVDRYLIAAEVGGVGMLLCVNKIDLAAEPDEVDGYRALGLPVVNTSCVDGAGIDDLREALRGKLSILAGQSGTGKSSLINSMDPTLRLATRQVSDDTQKGRHATTASRIYQLDGGIRIIDTPGIRQLGLWGVTSQELDYYFPEIARFAAECRFRNCVHDREPDCAVRSAVESGQIAAHRYESYHRIRRSLEEEV